MRWNAAMDAHKLVSQATQDLAWTAGTLNNGEETEYGFGWFVGSDDDGRWVNHEGEYGGFRSYFSKQPDKGVMVMVLSNFAEAEPDQLGDSISESLGAESE